MKRSPYKTNQVFVGKDPKIMGQIYGHIGNKSGYIGDKYGQTKDKFCHWGQIQYYFGLVDN